MSHRSKKPKKGQGNSDSSEEEEGEEKEKGEDAGSEDISENAEEDIKAQVLLSKEEAENALFKRLFQNKIKQMTCMKQVQYYLMVTVISLLMCGYFTLSYFMVTQIFTDSQ